MMKALKVVTVNEVIRRADAARASPRGAGSMDFSTPSAEGGATVLELTPEEQSLKDYLESLSAEQMSDLMALMWLGRGDCAESRHDYPELVEFAASGGDAPYAASYVAEKGPLADYLRAGLVALRRSDGHAATGQNW